MLKKKKTISNKRGRKDRNEKEKNLHVALDEIERSDGHVGEATAEDATGTACSVVSRRKHADALLGCRDHNIPTL